MNKMYKIIIALFLSSAILACNSSEQTSDNTSTEITTDEGAEISVDEVVASDTEDAPIITWDEDVYSFGEIEEGEEVNHVFTFTNTGKSPLIIADVKASCGCTTPEFTKEPIKPGESGKITVVFNSAGQRGKQQKIISVMSNAHPNISMVQLKGEVKETT